MRGRLLNAEGSLRTFAVVFGAGDDPIAGLETFAREHHVSGAQLTGIGAFSRVTVGYFDWQQKDYVKIPFDEQVEVLALTGNIGRKEGDPALHIHVVLGTAEGHARGGHLLAAVVRPTLEVIVTETPAHLQRRFDPETGLHLIDSGS